MNSALKPPVSSQNSKVPNQLSKPMHPQGTPTFNQPSGHISQNPYPNMNVAHNHPNAQQNHFSLNVPNATPHFTMGSIPPSNHPVASMSQSSAGQQLFGQQKSVNYSSSYQPNLGHPPNQNTMPPVCQTLPATPQIQSQQQSQANSTSQKTASSPALPAASTESPSPEKPQSNGTPEVKTPTKAEGQSNHVSPAASPAPSQILQCSQVPNQQTEKLPEKAKTQLVQEQKSPTADSVKPAEELVATPAPAASSTLKQAPTQAATSANNETDPLKIDEPKSNEPTENVPKTQEKNEVEEVLENSSTPMEIDPLSTEKEEPSNNSSSKDTKATENSNQEGNQAQVTPIVKNQEDIAEEKQTIESEQKPAETAPQPVNKVSEPETPTKTNARTVRKTKTSKADEPKTPKAEPKTPVQKSPGTGKVKRQRTMTQHYQSPLPEVEIVAKMTSSRPRNRSNDDKLTYFYKNEFLAVRNAEGGFYLCQAVQNIYKSSSKIKIRWLSQDKNDKTGEIYTPDFYDLTDFDCILTSIELVRVDKGKFRLTKAEKERTDSILKRCLAVEKGEIASPSVSEEHPDGLDLSLYKDEEQLKKRKGTKRKASSVSRKKSSTVKSPDTPKVQKVEVNQIKKATPVVKKITPTPKKPAPVESKKSVTPSRTTRDKRKSEPKTSPVVDQKKARVLAKIGRKSAVSAASTNRTPPPAKNVKPVKPVPSTSKASQKPPVVTNLKATTVTTRKTKRSTRK